MRPDEYDALIEDPTGYLFNTWLPRVSRDVSPMGQPTSFRNNMSFLKGGMAMLSYFSGFGTQAALLRSESGSASAISGILKAPFDILADKLRGYKGLCMDMFRQPNKVLAACEAMAPHLLQVALSGADPDKNVPIGLWMHRGCVPFLSPSQFDRYYWPTLKWMIEELWAARAPDPLLCRRRMERQPEVDCRVARSEHRVSCGQAATFSRSTKRWGTSSA